MKEGVVFRQGRKVHISDRQKASESWCCEFVLLPLLACVSLIGFVAYLYQKEAYFLAQQEAFAELKGEVVSLPDAEASTLQDHWSRADANIMHFSGRYNASVSDSAFNLRFDHVLKLHRHTEYCQWQETSYEECQTCKRKKSNGEEESYSCNCVRQYSYIKAWRPHRILSMGFDQPANHHNPQRDPFPSTDIFSGDAKVGVVQISHSIVQKLQGQMDPVTFSPNGHEFRPGFFKRMWFSIFGEPNMRYDSLEQLRPFHESLAFREHHFVFTNTWEGWFFSAYDMPVWQRAIRGFGQWLEGSLFDWQIGDLYDMVGGCTPGDLRSRFYVVDPEDISVLGQIESIENKGYRVVPYRTSNNFPVGIIHVGEYSSSELFAFETMSAKNACKWARFGVFLSAAAATFFLTRFGFFDSVGYLPPMCAVLGIGLILMSLVWAIVYGNDSWTIGFGVCGCIAVGYSMQSPANVKCGKKLG